MVEFLQLSLKHVAKHMMHACGSFWRYCMACHTEALVSRADWLCSRQCLPAYRFQFKNSPAGATVLRIALASPGIAGGTIAQRYCCSMP